MIDMDFRPVQITDERVGDVPRDHADAVEPLHVLLHPGSVVCKRYRHRFPWYPCDVHFSSLIAGNNASARGRQRGWRGLSGPQTCLVAPVNLVCGVSVGS